MWWQVLALAATAVSVSGHGRVLEPPARGTMWRFGFSTQPNYDDDGLNCGGFYHQYSVNGGKCGICGDPYDMESPRTHELGGRYGQGTIVAEYEAGQIFSTTVEITAHHKGYWIFKICPDPYSIDQDCFDANPIELEEGGTQYYPPNGGKFNVNYRLPSNLICDHCVLQWRYVAGNNWGDCKNGTQGLGCGDQENFLACSDISIKRSSYIPVESIPIPLDFDYEGKDNE
ncbi:uncharacterized protein LOC121735538 [Aricia agestis]|uniref:uncharacterized protein LOC121735538 n=1 Tax=Aricia agestis TaxID=91739 RepID=UPI001C201C7B|nr:uncharacterized protein LOC121735538 [Aricia agestis]XP_041982320.1 uncharacterized protein LOC121735538 [Aricia agestis]